MTAPRKKRTDRYGRLHLEGYKLKNADVQFAVPQRITNASSTARYVPPTWHVREGGGDHKRFRSLGWAT